MLTSRRARPPECGVTPGRCRWVVLRPQNPARRVWRLSALWLVGESAGARSQATGFPHVILPRMPPPRGLPWQGRACRSGAAGGQLQAREPVACTPRSAPARAEASGVSVVARPVRRVGGPFSGANRHFVCHDSVSGRESALGKPRVLAQRSALRCASVPPALSAAVSVSVSVALAKVSVCVGWKRLHGAPPTNATFILRLLDPHFPPVVLTHESPRRGTVEDDARRRARVWVAKHACVRVCGRGRLTEGSAACKPRHSGRDRARIGSATSTGNRPTPLYVAGRR